MSLGKALRSFWERLVAPVPASPPSSAPSSISPSSVEPRPAAAPEPRPAAPTPTVLADRDANKTVAPLPVSESAPAVAGGDAGVVVGE